MQPYPARQCPRWWWHQEPAKPRNLSQICNAASEGHLGIGKQRQRAEEAHGDDRDAPDVHVYACAAATARSELLQAAGHAVRLTLGLRVDHGLALLDQAVQLEAEQ